MCNDVAYNGGRVCEAVQSVEECGLAASDHVRHLCIVGFRNRMAGMVGKYRNSGYLPADTGRNADYIQNTVIITKRVYDLLCNGIGVFYDTAVSIALGRCGPVQNTVCYLHRLQFPADDWAYHVQKKRV